MKKTIKVSAIKNGTVIDHIPTGQAMKIINYLKIKDGNHNNGTIIIGVNFDSLKMKKKDVIKIENKELTPEEVNQIAVFAPEASIAIIKNFDKVKKYKVKVPKVFVNVIQCPNPKCITNHEAMKTRFETIEVKPLKVQCLYCEKKFNDQEITLK